MKRFIILAWAFSMLSWADRSLGAEGPLVLDLWPGKPAGEHGSIGPERVRAPEEAPTRDARWITNVTCPTISVFRPDAKVNAKVAMVICPGGGYWNLAWDKEGEEVAAWLNTVGITGVVLKYRVPRRPGEPEPLPAPGPLLDSQRAVSLVRSLAGEWDIDPARIGIIGFSAGGHLATMTTISLDRRSYEPIDAVDRVSCRPNFAVVAYPGYILEKPGTDRLAPYIRVPKEAGPFFLVHASDDQEPGAQPEQSQALYRELRRVGVPVELHIYERGGHGFGVRKTGLAVSKWTERCVDWLIDRKILPAGNGRSDSGGSGVLPEGDTGLAARYPRDRGIGRDAAVLFHDDFESGEPSDRWDMAYHRRNIRLTDAKEDVKSGRRSLEFSVPQGPEEVSNELVKQLGDGRDVVFLRYYSKYDPAFDQVGSSHNGALLAAIAPGVPFATPGVRAGGTNKFSASLESWRGESEKPSPGQLNIYCYHPGQRSEYGDHFFPTGRVLPFSTLPGSFGAGFDSRPDVVPALGRWACYELMVRANSAGKSDGQIACWLDGKLIADFPGLRLRDTDSLKINRAGIGLHIRSNPTRANRKWYDDVVIATSYIGPRVEHD